MCFVNTTLNFYMIELFLSNTMLWIQTNGCPNFLINDYLIIYESVPLDSKSLEPNQFKVNSKVGILKLSSRL